MLRLEIVDLPRSILLHQSVYIINPGIRSIDAPGPGRFFGGLDNGFTRFGIHINDLEIHDLTDLRVGLSLLQHRLFTIPNW
ncbi:hypothetical protein D3C71_1648030 [compost metagenome]